MKVKFFLTTLLLVLSWLAAGCLSTHQVSLWKSEKFTGGPLKVIMVVAVAEKAVSRKEFESAMAARLRRDGVEAVPSVDVLPTDKELSRETIENAVRHTGIEGVLVVRIIEKEVTLAPVQDTKYYDVTKKYVYNAVDQQFYEKSAEVKVESTLYETARGDAVWTVTTDTQGPASPESFAKSVIEAVANALRKSGLVGKRA